RTPTERGHARVPAIHPSRAPKFSGCQPVSPQVIVARREERLLPWRREMPSIPPRRDPCTLRPAVASPNRQGKPIARWGRKATGQESLTAGLPKKAASDVLDGGAPGPWRPQ